MSAPVDVREALAALCNEKNIGREEWLRRAAVELAVSQLIDRAQRLVIYHSNGVLIERDVEDLRAAIDRVTGGAS